jgi:Transposase DDE domain
LKPTTCPSWLAPETLAALPEALVLREVRDGISRPGCRTRQITLVTTLLDAAVYRADDRAALYQLRWPVETALAQLKTTMQMEVLHCKTVPGVRKEWAVFALVYNLVRIVMSQAARLQYSGVKRISVLDTLRWVSAPSTGMPLGALLVNPVRPHRVEPRVKKRRFKPFPLIMKPRQALRQPLVEHAFRS